MQFDVQFDVRSVRRTRQLQATVATSIEVACRSFLNTSNVNVAETDANTFRVIVILDSALPASVVVGIVSSPNFISTLSDIPGLEVRRVYAIETYIDAVTVRMPPPSTPARQPSLIIAVSVAAVAIIVPFTIYILKVLYRKFRVSSPTTFAG